jgi:quinol-cytochrome oxidoreductase complex cytochrome b subunit
LNPRARTAVLGVTLLFIAGLGVLTVDGFANHGVTVVGILAVLILVLFSVGIVGALRRPPRG